jgi:hypothetical protein
MDNLGYIIGPGGTITAMATTTGKSFTVAPDHKNYGEILKALQEDNLEEFTRLVDIVPQVQAWGSGKLEVRDDTVLFNGEPVHGSIVPRVVEHFQQGISVDYLANFLGRLSKNPSYRAVNELYEFLEHRGLPLTKSGTFLAYKGVRHDWFDRYSGTIENAIGKVIEVPRNKVDDDRTRACSRGLHCGTLDYVISYCTERVLLVEVDPADVVSVPTDCDAQKCRVCRYKVVAEYQGELVRKNQPISDPVCDDWDEDDDWDDACDECGCVDCCCDC